MQKHSGFTLLELMISMSIVGIIAATALPSYRQSVLKTNRTDAHITMSGLATQQERFYFTHNRYTGDFADIVQNAVSGNPIASDDGLYSITLAATGGGTGWVMEATAVGSQLKDLSCRKMSLTSLGVKTARDSSDAVSSDCWR